MDDKTKQSELKLFEDSINAAKKEFQGYKMKEFTFTASEQQLLAQMETIISLADQGKQVVLNAITLKRLGIEPHSSMKLRYHIGLGRFVLFVPKEVKEVKTK